MLKLKSALNLMCVLLVKQIGIFRKVWYCIWIMIKHLKQLLGLLEYEILQNVILF